MSVSSNGSTEPEAAADRFDALVRLRRLRTRSLVAAWTCMAAAGLVVLGIGMVWVYPGLFDEAIRDAVPGGTVPAIGHAARLAALVAISVPAALFIVALLRLAVMFRRMAKGRVLTPQNARTLSGVGWLLLWVSGLSVLSHTAVVLAVTLANPPGQRTLSVSLGSQELAALTGAMLCLAFGLVLKEAAHLAEDNAGFV